MVRSIRVCSDWRFVAYADASDVIGPTIVMVEVQHDHDYVPDLGNRQGNKSCVTSSSGPNIASKLVKALYIAFFLILHSIKGLECL